MPLNKVKTRIQNEAEEEAEQIIQEAEEEAEETRQEAENKAEKIKTEAQKEAQEAKKDIRRKKESSAEMESRRKVQRARQQAIDEAFESFQDRAHTLIEENPEDFLSSCKDKAGFEVSRIEGPEHLEELADNEFEVSQEPGVVLYGEDGKRSLDLTLENITESIREDEKSEVAEVLFQ
jgi:Archaeal/vacuolar-type H+-ATPase subunit E